MKLLGRFSLVKINFASSILAAIVILLLAALTISVELTERRNAQNDLRLLEALKALDNVAHQHAVERGLTAGFLGNPSDEARAKVTKQRTSADAAAQTLDDVIARLSGDFPVVANTTVLLRQQLSAKPKLRQEVDALSGANAFGFYSQVNRLAVDALGSLTNEISSNAVNTDLAMAQLLGKFKERAGQVRGKINGTLARGAINDATRAEVRGYQQEMELIVSYLENQVSGERLEKARAVLGDSTSEQISAILKQVLGDSPNFDQLPSPAQWFPLATKQIGGVKKLLDEEWAAVESQAQKSAAAANLKLWLTIGLLILAIILLSWINLGFASVLRNSLRRLTQQLQQIAGERDLSIKLDTESKNELGEIARSVRQTLVAVETTLKELIDSVSSSGTLVTELDSSSDQLLGNARETQRVSTSISSAVEENAATASEIANAAASTLDAVRELGDSSNENQQRFSDTLQKMDALQQSAQDIAGLSNKLDSQVDQITDAVKTINVLFEQTNLLALNASIEAARAGEQGRGFSVVADEVRSLALKSLESSERISEVLASLQQASAAISRSSEQNGELNAQAAEQMLASQASMAQMNEVMANLESMATSVATASEEQSSVSAVIAQDTASVLDASNASLELSEKLQTMSKTYRDSSEHMLGVARKFKV
jgi:methyl-accepting chemotaxis protein